MNIDEIYKLINTIGLLTYEGKTSKAKKSINRLCTNTIEKLNHEGLT
tara:strand:+ start:574 stop:714 length:141 start_codon:yes stop_codon:yes gene_type:complete